MKYPYLQERGKFAPIIPIKLEGKVGWITFDAYVDSGATYSIFKPEMAEILGLELEKGEKVYVTVGDGSLITVYLHKVRIDLAGKKIEATIGFSKQLGIGFNIIGRKDIFEKFIIAFDEKGKQVEFTMQDGDGVRDA